MRLERERALEIEFAVEIGVREPLDVFAVHADPSSATSAAASWARARDNRDMTVPTGAATTSAISL